MGTLTQGRDAGGPRLFLDGRPVTAGTLLEVRLPGGRWLPVRVEGPPEAPRLHVRLGGAWERHDYDGEGPHPGPAELVGTVDFMAEAVFRWPERGGL